MVDTLADVFFPMRFYSALPQVFPSPFDVRPHATAVQAAQALKAKLLDLNVPFDGDDGGKMFGVLVVRNSSGDTGYLAAYSGMLGGQWRTPGFVPPVFDQSERHKLLESGEREVEALTRELHALESDAAYLAMVEQAKHCQENQTQQLQNLKKLHADRKQLRHRRRENPDVTEQQLHDLAEQSRGDKQELKNLKRVINNEEKIQLAKMAPQRETIDTLKKQRKSLSASLQKKLFAGYRLRSVDGNVRNLIDLYKNKMPPSGAGDCAATKLVQFANLHQLEPVAVAEFWWGGAPVGGLREHNRFYPSCRSRCRVILPTMLQGLTVSVPLHEQPVEFNQNTPETLYEDDDVVVVTKPAGLLSVPGKVLIDSVELRLKARYPNVDGVMLLHRLDQSTSGIMVAAKNPAAYKSLQHQFQDRSIEKRYVAVLDGVLEAEQGEVSLPLRLDYYDRPRQIVCHQRGKPSLTRYEVVSRSANTTRVVFYPHTGRTHQLRVHAAHPDGLNCPILGDELYGRPGDRLHLHAERLTFTHPVTGDRLSFASTVEF